MIEVRNLSKHYATTRALDNVEFTVGSGEVCGLIGPNGAGKTTLLKILATLTRPSKGSALVAGFDVRRQAVDVRRAIGYMPDVFGSYEEIRVDGYLQFFAHIYRLPPEDSWRTIDDILRLVDLAHLRNRPVSGLSLGARQRLGLGRALLHNPEVLLLDEPVSGLDPRARVEMRELLRELGRMGKTVLISSHVLADLADLCGRLVVIEKGRSIFAGTLEELKRKVMPGRRVEISVEGDPESARRFLESRPWTRGIHALEGGGLELLLDADDGVALADVSSTLFAAGFRLTRFQERELDLEEAFLRVTKGGDA